MNLKIVDRETFYEYQCQGAFIRVSWLTGRIGDTVYLCLDPLTDEQIMKRSIENLQGFF